jgi:hypothetical protein
VHRGVPGSARLSCVSLCRLNGLTLVSPRMRYRRSGRAGSSETWTVGPHSRRPRSLPGSAVDTGWPFSRVSTDGRSATISYVSGMTVHGLQDSHHPTGLTEAVIRVEQPGFGAAMCSYHFSRWSERHFDEAFKHAPPEKVAVVHVSPDLGRHAAWLKAYTGLGFDEIYLHHVVKKHEFIAACGACVLPELS